MEFSNREIASAILIVAGLTLAILKTKDKSKLGANFKQFFGVLFSRQITTLFALYFAYTAGLIARAHHLDLWSWDLTSVTLLTVFLTGIPLFMNANKYEDGGRLVRIVVVEVVGVTALLITYVNLAEFPIWGELLLQAALFFLVLLVAFAANMPTARTARRVFEFTLGILVLGLIIFTTSSVLSDLEGVDWGAELQAFALSVWLPIALVPFLYVLAWYMAVESAVRRLSIFVKDRKKPLLRVRLALIIGLRFSLRNAKRFVGNWNWEIAKESTWRGARSVMRSFRGAVKTQVRMQREHDKLVRERKGLRGVDQDGYWLDRREFRETRGVLEDARSTQSAIALRSGKYVNESWLWSSYHLKNLPRDHEIQIELSPDKRTWRAWRRTVGGYVFGVGGTRQADDIWLYAGTEEPATMPRADSDRWMKVSDNEKPKEWATLLDEPIPVS